jgi:hypothetical protein
MDTPRAAALVKFVARGSIALALAILLLSASPAGSRAAPAYSCGTPSTGHCYGITQWGRSQYFGSYTDISMVHLQCDVFDCLIHCSSVFSCSIPGGFIDDEMWLIDRGTPACLSNGFGSCWVEAGYWTQYSPLFSMDYFWADVRPGSGIFVHVLGSVPDHDIGARTHFMIVRDDRTAARPYLSFIYSDSGTFYLGTSTANTMTANEIDIGQELAGAGGAGAPVATFTRNIWAVQGLGPEYVFWYSPQPGAGTVRSSNPPVAQWDMLPGTTGAPEGGQFSTHCC